MEPYITPFNEWPLAVRKKELAQNLVWQKMKMVTQLSFQTGPMCGILDSKSWKSRRECNKKFLKKERSIRRDTEPLPTNQARPLMYVPIIKKYICTYILGCMKSARCYNLVLVIKDQGYALTIDFIKKKQNGPWCLFMQLKIFLYKLWSVLWPWRLFNRFFRYSLSVREK